MRHRFAALAILLATSGCVVEDAEQPGDEAASVEQPIGALCQTAVAFSNVAFEVPTISGVAHAEFHQRGGLTYVAGQYLDVVFTLPTCPQFTAVTVDGLSLPSAPGIDGGSYYQKVSDVAVSGGHRVRVRLWLDNSATGTRHAVQVWANNSYRFGARTIDVAWVGVEDISGQSKVSLSAEQLRSNMASATYRAFGDDGWQRDADGVKTGWHSFGYQELSMSVTDSIRFHAVQKYRVYSTPFNCDITATVDGRFQISRYDSEPATAGNQWKLRIDWIKPSPSHPMPFQMSLTDGGCLLGLSTLVGGVVAVWENIFMDSVKDAIGDGIIDGFECGLPGDLDCGLLIERFEYTSGELIAVLDGALLDGVGDGFTFTVLAPYRASSASDVTGGALVLPAGQRVLITQAGLVTGCHTDVGSPSPCPNGSIHRFGATGLFNWSNSATWPVPDPYEYGAPPLPQREKALAAHAGMLRAPTQLPVVHGYPGALLGRTPTTRHDVSRPCVIETPSGSAATTLQLGRNDRSSGGTPYGSGTVRVIARFVAQEASCPVW